MASETRLERMVREGKIEMNGDKRKIEKKRSKNEQ
jgi:hypothetical protein